MQNDRDFYNKIGDQYQMSAKLGHDPVSRGPAWT